MGRKQTESTEKTAEQAKEGQEISEHAEHKIEEAEASNESLRRVEAVEEEDEDNIEKATEESRAIAKGINESEVQQPGENVIAAFRETSQESTGYSEMEMQAAATAAEMTADYSGVGSDLSSKLEQSGQVFQELAEAADREGEDLKADLAQKGDTLEGVF